MELALLMDIGSTTKVTAVDLKSVEIKAKAKTDNRM